jgi:hypothetical protein
VLLNLEVNESAWSASRCRRFSPLESAPDTRCVGGWVGIRVFLIAVVKIKNLLPYQQSKHTRADRTQSFD